YCYLHPFPTRRSSDLMEVIEEEGLVANAAERGHQLLAGTRDRATEAVGDVRGLGRLVGSEFTTADGRPDGARAAAAQQAAAAKGLLMLTCGAYMNTVRMIPPLVVSAEEIEEGLSIWSEVLAEV